MQACIDDALGWESAKGAGRHALIQP
jgi:hypothetical protein